MTWPDSRAATLSSAASEKPVPILEMDWYVSEAAS